MIRLKNLMTKQRITAGSILRMLEYQELSRLSLSGRILDLGGSIHSGYQKLACDKEAVVDTINIDPNTGANMLGSVEDPFPAEDNSYDSVLAINLIEHVYKVLNVFTETSRVLKPQGQFIIVVPFFHHVHASPDDYHRYTSSSLRRMCSDAGLEIVELKELGGGLFSTWFQMLGGAIKPKMLRDIIKDGCHNLDVFLGAVSKGYAKMRKNNPLGYFVIAKKC